MSYLDLHFDAKTAIARTSIAVWNALMRSDPIFGRYALSDAGRSAFLAAFTVVNKDTWTVGGKLHRADGQPARTWGVGAMEWWEFGQQHRTGGPARVFANGSEEWFERGACHRTGDQPACVVVGCLTAWYEHDKLHRIGGPAIVRVDGTEEWYERGRLHRVGGPAITYANGCEEWYERGQLHRIGGPAATYPGGVKWYEHGTRVAPP